MQQKLLIIIPCYNEEASLPGVLLALQAIKIFGYEITAVVINDCSTDQTKPIAERNNAIVLNLPINLGIGGTVQTGIKYAFDNNFDLVLQLDGDGQHPPAEIIKLINSHKDTSANIVIGSRFIDKEGFQSSRARRIGIRYFHWLNRLFTGVAIYDSTSGFRLLDRNAMQVAVNYYPDDYPEPESVVLFSKAGLKIKEVAVIMSRRLGGRSSISASASLYYCVKVSIAMFFSFIRKTN